MKKSFCFHLIFISLGLMTLLLLPACKHEKPKVVELTFAFGPDDSKTTEPLINDFNRKHEGEIKVNWVKTSRVSDEYFADLKAQFESGTTKYDVFGADVIWTSNFAANEWVEDLSSQMHDHFPPKAFLPAAMNAATYQYHIWGVPWFTDAGVIFYRKDLLEANGFTNPPATWEELKTIAKKVMASTDIDYGYVFQGANYEGGVANACEFIWNAGGSLMISDLSVEGEDANIITADNKQTEIGFSTARTLIDEGISPSEVANFKELESAQLFQRGRAIFLRGWPGTYGYLTDVTSELSAGQIGVCPIPVSLVGTASNSCLGGWNLMINAMTDAAKKEAAWKFIQFMADADQQLFRARNGGPMPAYKDLYTNADLLTNAPVAALVGNLIENARSRPISPHYMEFSPKIGKIFNQVLKGEVLPEYAAYTLQSELEGVLETHRLSVN